MPYPVCENRGMDAKQSMRDAHLAYRRHLRATPAIKRELDQAISGHAAAYLESLGAVNAAAYHPLASEPGGSDFVPALAAACRRLFLPVSLAGGVLHWAAHSDAAAQGALGITEPSGPRFNSHVLRSCDAIIVPALAVDATGMRLGKGAGYYDRALAGLPVPTIAVVYARERVDTVPHGSHDIPVTAVITEEGITRLGGTSAL